LCLLPLELGDDDMGMMQEFKEFALKGNFVDLAVGVIIGGAFQKVVDALVNNILMPPIGYAIGGVDFKDLAISLTAPGGKAVAVKYGAFIQAMIDFAIIAFVLFSVIKGLNAMKKRFEKQAAAAPPAPTPPAQSEIYLREIRDALAKR
jgi:large conductance mechanosensitive channel